MTLSESSVRETILTRLEQDILGPRSANETLTSLPSDTYLTGILWLPDLRSNELDDEDDQKSAGDDQEFDTASSILGQAKPSSLGLSFANSADGDKRVKATFSGAAYTPITKTEGKSAKSTQWMRQTIEVFTEFELNVGLERRQLAFGDNIQVEIVRRTKIGPGKTLLTTISVSNKSQSDSRKRVDYEQLLVFQSRLIIAALGSTSFVPRPIKASSLDAELASSQLLYRNHQEYAVGHQASCHVLFSNGKALEIQTEWIPRQLVPSYSEVGDAEFFSTVVKSGKLSAHYLSTHDKDHVVGALKDLCASYEQWISRRKSEIGDIDSDFQVAAEVHMDTCQLALFRMKSGVNALENDPNLLRSFQLANLAIDLQHKWKNPSSNVDLTWRPFQLAFILLTLESVVNPDSDFRETFDLLWFPTGGGKTEAYLAIIAVASWYRRLTSPLEPASNVALMRYTLRLLTSQQFSRAAALLLACEKIRRSDLFQDDNRPRAEFSIGLWVGMDASPNTFAEAKKALSDPTRPSPIQIEKCFVCDRKLDWRPVPSQSGVRPSCSNAQCDLGLPFGTWPVSTVDEDLYLNPPTLLIGTVDKFAQVPINKDAKNLFGFGSKNSTALIIQDELHLISGPLGTMVGLYEIGLDWLLSQGGNRPKLIGSTATVRRAQEQTRSVFDRQAFQFPPPGLDASNSGFAVVDQSKPGRLYVGVTTAGRSAKFTIQAVAGSLMQSASLEAGLSNESRDGYATLLMYYQSLRELGGALVQVLDDIPDSMGIYARARGEETRNISSPQELTSRVSQREIVSMLKTLEIKCDSNESIDAVLATNMVSVGLDISRLGLMVLQGQPKSRSEYIQATSRVGRSSQFPGLVVTVLNAAKTRDQSSFETFTSWHGAIYRDVEPTSATPFAPRAQERALHAAIVSMLRYSAPGLLDSPDAIDSVPSALVAEIQNYIERRCESVAGPDSTELEQAKKLFSDFMSFWEDKSPRKYKDDRDLSDSLMQSAELAARSKALGRLSGDARPTPNSMRTVEPSSLFRIKNKLSSRFVPNVAPIQKED